jgi:hypothetical protein
VTYPGGGGRKPTDWNYLALPSYLEAVGPRTSLTLFDPAADIPRLTFTRIGDAGRRGLFSVRIAERTARPIFHLALPVDSTGWSPPDYAASLTVVDRVQARVETIAAATGIRLRVRGLGRRQVLHLTLMEDDGTSWSSALTVDSTWSEPTVPLERFTAARGVKLPQGFPGEWNYWVGPAEGRGGRGDRVRLQHLERLQLSLRREDAGKPTPEGYGVEVEWVGLDVGAGEP